jgi:hypothetical protein
MNKPLSQDLRLPPHGAVGMPHDLRTLNSKMLLTKACVIQPCKVAKSACYHIAADCQTTQQRNVRGQPVSMTTWSRSKRMTCLMTVPVVRRSLDICGIHGTNEPITNTIQFPIKMSWLTEAL